MIKRFARKILYRSPLARSARLNLGVNGLFRDDARRM
jgi:hypothetical protein